uniref:Hypothetical conserved protein n=1 Tax=uncultured Chloroflexota bacterium TaxID=166587 RepID=H5SN26_9CHLR|nr:hypothetical conserved protein [uncultured Chloroflexota bacterium]
MKFNRKKLFQLLSVPLFLALVLASLTWLQTTASPVAAQEPEEVGLSLVVSGDSAAASAAAATIPTFQVGDVFTVSIVAQGVGDPGIFGGQFEISFDPTKLQVVTGTLVPGSALAPWINPVNEVDNVTGLIRYAVSRQGDVENLTGDVVLATLSFEAVGATEPPEGQTTLIDLLEAKLGAKGGIEVPVSGLVDLEVIIKEGPAGEMGDIQGNVKVEGRADDNQAGHLVTDGGVLSTTTQANGDFFLLDVAFGTYDLTASSPGFLAATCTGLVHNSDPTILNDVVLLAGDIVEDGVIDIADAVAIGAVFGSTDPDEVADLNDDGVVDVLDLILMAANFGQTSADNPWVCQ